MRVTFTNLIQNTSILVLNITIFAAKVCFVCDVCVLSSRNPWPLSPRHVLTLKVLCFNKQRIFQPKIAAPIPARLTISLSLMKSLLIPSKFFSSAVFLESCEKCTKIQFPSAVMNNEVDRLICRGVILSDIRLFSPSLIPLRICLCVRVASDNQLVATSASIDGVWPCSTEIQLKLTAINS